MKAPNPSLSVPGCLLAHDELRSPSPQTALLSRPMMGGCHWIYPATLAAHKTGALKGIRLLPPTSLRPIIAFLSNSRK